MIPWNEVVSKLAVDTERNVVRWVPVRDHGPDMLPLVVGVAYVSEVKGKRIRVYEYQYPSSWDEDGAVLETTSDVAIEFIDQVVNRLEYRIPSTESRWKLLESIRLQASQVPEFVNAFLKAS